MIIGKRIRYKEGLTPSRMFITFSVCCEPCLSLHMNIPQTFSHYVTRSVIADKGEHVHVISAFDALCEKEVACKIFRRDHPNFELVEQEIRTQQLLSHPCIAPIIDVVYHKEMIFVVMELYHTDLLTLTIEGKLSLHMKLKLFAQVVEAIKYLHQRGIAHLDIKPDNVFIDADMNAKLADFGCCETPLSRSRPFFCRGTLVYSAPEMITFSSKDRRQADIWSLGIMLYAMIAKTLPWKIGSNDEIIKQICSGKIEPSNSITPNIDYIIRNCIVLDPNRRFTAEQLYEVVKNYSLDKTAEVRRWSSSRQTISNKGIVKVFKHSINVIIPNRRSVPSFMRK